jgi:hypothetical protein
MQTISALISPVQQESTRGVFDDPFFRPEDDVKRFTQGKSSLSVSSSHRKVTLAPGTRLFHGDFVS